MGRRVAILLLLAVLGPGLAACSSTGGKPENANLFPADYRKEIVATLRKFFKSNDTVKVTGAMVSEPALTQVDKDQRYVACVRYTAHGVNPGEIGDAVRVAYFYGGHLNQLIAAGEGQCVKVAYKPFSELNQYCVGVGCQN
jgi:hypothetical protein